MDGGSVAGTLFIVFLVLKLTHLIAWSWWWVFSPLWIDVAATLALLLLIVVGAVGSFGVFKAVTVNKRAGHARR